LDRQTIVNSRLLGRHRLDSSPKLQLHHAAAQMTPLTPHDQQGHMMHQLGI
jgi:hypothetical protein